MSLRMAFVTEWLALVLCPLTDDSGASPVTTCWSCLVCCFCIKVVAEETVAVKVATGFVDAESPVAAEAAAPPGDGTVADLAIARPTTNSNAAGSRTAPGTGWTGTGDSRRRRRRCIPGCHQASRRHRRRCSPGSHQVVGRRRGRLTRQTPIEPTTAATPSLRTAATALVPVVSTIIVAVPTMSRESKLVSPSSATAAGRKASASSASPPITQPRIESRVETRVDRRTPRTTTSRASKSTTLLSR